MADETKPKKNKSYGGLIAFLIGLLIVIIFALAMYNSTTPEEKNILPAVLKPTPKNTPPNAPKTNPAVTPEPVDTSASTMPVALHARFDNIVTRNADGSVYRQDYKVGEYIGMKEGEVGSAYTFYNTQGKLKHVTKGAVTT